MTKNYTLVSHVEYLLKYCGKDDGNLSNETDFEYDIDPEICYTEEVIFLIKTLHLMPEAEFQFKIAIAKAVRILEFIGLSLSLLSLITCVLIFFLHRSLRNDRTIIHINLFLSVFFSSLIKFCIIIEQFLSSFGIVPFKYAASEEIPILCETLYAVLEYSKSTIFMWMFVEAWHLHRAVAVTATRMSFKRYYLFFGWGTPGIFVIIWVIMMASQSKTDYCWLAYNYNRLYWILEAQRLLVLAINTFYLGSTIYSVSSKLRRNTSTDTERIWKATKATLALMPLLGITNYIIYLEPKWDCSLWYFILYSFFTYSITSFQGLIISLLYCLLNQEVKDVLFRRVNRSLFWSTSSDIPTQHSFIKRKVHDDASAESGCTFTV